MTFQLGDSVRHGTHVGTVTDVGTVLIQVTTSEGARLVFCPWELVKIRTAKEALPSRYPRMRLVPCGVR